MANSNNLQPKRFSEYTPFEDVNGSEIVPAVKDGNNGVVRLSDIPLKDGVQQDIDSKAATADLAPVAFSGDYDDLTGTPPTPTFPVTSVNTQTGDVILTKSDVGLSNVDNTSDATKPVSTATQTALNAKAPLASPAFTGTPTGITKAHVGLPNVDNTSDASKPVSTATQTALNGKEPTIPTGSSTQYVKGDKTLGTLDKTAVGLANVDNTSDASKPVSTAQATAINAKVTDAIVDGQTAVAPSQNAVFDALALKESIANKGAASGYASLGSDGKIPTTQLPALAINDTFVVASQAAMLALVAQRGDIAIRTDSNLTYILSTDSPTTLADWKQILTPASAVQSVNGQTGVVALTKSDVGLGNVDNTADTAKPVSTAQATAIAAKVNKAGDAMTGTLTTAPGTTAMVPLVIPQGVVSTALTRGAIEFDGINLFYTNDTGTLNRIPLVGESRTQTLINKTMNGAQNTFSNISADSTVDGTTNKAYTATEKTKLAGVATGATANSTDAQLRDRSTHTGTQSADSIVDGTTNKVLSAADKTRLANTTGTNTGDQVISDATITTSDITTNNASTTKHGFLPKLPGSASQYLDGTGAFSTPAGGGGGTVVDATTTTKGIVQLAGDLAGTAAAPKVKGKMEVYNVKDYGAIGNGTADDSAAITAAFTAANAATNGGIVFFPAGTFLTGQIIWRAKTNIQGSGIGRTIIKAKNALNADLIITENFATEHNVNYNGYTTMSKNFARDFSMDGNLSNQTMQAEQTDKSAYRYLIKYYGWIPYFERLEFRNSEAAFYTEYSNNQPQEYEWFNISDGVFRDLTMINYGRAGWTFYGPHDSHVSNIRIFGGNYDFPEYDWLVGLSGTWGAQGAMVDDVHIRSGTTSTGYNVILKAGINGRIYAEGSTNINVLVQSDGSNLQIFSGFQDADNNSTLDGMVVLKPTTSGDSVSKNIIEAIAYYGPMFGDIFRIDNTAGGSVNGNRLTTRVNNGATVTGHLFRLIGNIVGGSYTAGGGQASLAAFNTDAYTGGNNVFAGQVYGQTIFTTDSAVGKSDLRNVRSDNYPDAQRVSQYRWPVGDKSPGFISTGSDTYIEADSMQVRNVATATANGHAVNKGQMDTADALKANIASPAFTGTPTAPTPTAGDNTTKLATTAFVSNAVSGLDDVLAYANLAAFPATGTGGTIYVANDTNFLYRWSGSAYIQVGGGTAADATAGTKGIVQLTNDLGGTAAAPQVMVGRTLYDNLVPNPTFKDDLTNWKTYGSVGTLTRETGAGAPGQGTNITQTSATATDAGLMSNTQFTLTPGTYTLSWDESVGSTVTRSVVVLRGGEGTKIEVHHSFSGVGNSNFNRYSASFTISTTGSYEILAGLGYSGSSPGTVKFANFLLERAATASPYFDGNTASSGFDTYSWTGATNSSTSRRTTITRLQNTDQLLEGLVNQYFTQARAVAALAGQAVFTGSLSTGTLTAAATQINGLRSAYLLTTASVTLDAQRRYVEITDAAHIVTLPTASGIAGREFTVVNVAATAATVNTTSGQFIGNAATPSATSDSIAAGGVTTYVSNGTHWRRV